MRNEPGLVRFYSAERTLGGKADAEAPIKGTRQIHALPLLLGIGACGFEVAGFHDRDSGRIHVLFERCVHLVDRQRVQFRVHLRIPVERATILFARRD